MWLNQHLFLNSGVWEPKIKVLEDLVSGERFFSGLQMTAISLCPEREREEKAGISTLMTSSKPNYFPRAPIPNAIILGAGASTYGFLEDRNI